MERKTKGRRGKEMRRDGNEWKGKAAVAGSDGCVVVPSGGSAFVFTMDRRVCDITHCWGQRFVAATWTLEADLFV